MSHQLMWNYTDQTNNYMGKHDNWSIKQSIDLINDRLSHVSKQLFYVMIQSSNSTTINRSIQPSTDQFNNQLMNQTIKWSI